MNNLPPPGDLANAIGFLSILEMAKDASKMKKALGQLKGELDSVTSAQELLIQTQKEIDDRLKTVAAAEAAIEKKRAKLADDVTALAAQRAALAEDRDAFKIQCDIAESDLIQRRRDLDGYESRVKAEAAKNAKDAKKIEADVTALNTREAALAAREIEVDVIRIELETKLAELRRIAG